MPEYPAGSSPHHGPTPDPDGSRPGQRPRRLVLVVDDNEDTREIYSRFLGLHGFDVQTAATGADAVQVAGTLLPDVIVMDLSLPHLDGWSATRQIKASPATGHIPIIICTGHAFDRSAERAHEAGCDVFLMKPCPPDDLLAAVTQLLGRSSSA